jgi:glutaminyl-peptide cyclotransferase
VEEEGGCRIKSGMTNWEIRMRSALLAILLAACQAAPAPQGSTASTLGAEPTNWGFRVVATYPHDPQAFTQGLFYLDGHLYESTGLVGRSTIRRVNIEDGRVLQSQPIPRTMFGEGIVNWGDQIISITWQTGIGYRWDRATFRQLGTWRYPGEGWGLTQNGTDIIMSDGTAELRFLDPETLQERRRVRVTAGGRPVDRLNELEFVNGEILANVWMTPRIARIDPASGNVTGWIDLTPLVQQTAGGDYDAVLNGIAYDAARDRLFVTGKNWPRLYEIDLVPAAPSR